MTTLFDLVTVLMDWILGLCGRRKTREKWGMKNEGNMGRGESYWVWKIEPISSRI